MKLYHVVPRETAVMILAEGFWDACSPWLPDRPEEGVWLTPFPMGCQRRLAPRME